MTVLRWKFDDGAGDIYTVPINPNKMSKIRAARSISTKVTTAVDGQTLFFEGRRQPQNLTFGGVIVNKDHLDQLTKWVYDKGRVTITDHFGRKLHCLLVDLDAQPKRSNNVYWRHDYTVTGLCYDVDESGAIDGQGYGAFYTAVVGPYASPGQVAAAGSSAVQYSFTSQASWHLTHSFTHRPLIETVDSQGREVFGSVSYPDDTHVVVTFSQPTSGTATLI